MVHEMTMMLALCSAQGTSSPVGPLATGDWGVQEERRGEQTSLDGVGTQ